MTALGITDNQMLVAAKLAECLRIARTRFPAITFVMPSVTFTLKGETAGTYNSKQNCFNFHDVFLNENIEDYVKETVPHEFAHYVYCVLFANSPGGKFIHHGKDWKTIVMLLGGTPSTSHSYSTTNIVRKHKTMPCVCEKCGEKLELSKIRYNRIVNNKATYTHISCGGKLAVL